MARPREFEPEMALSIVMDLFWRQGFEGTSMHDIERETGLKKQSLYRVFGDKRAMYLAALRHYEETEVNAALEILYGNGPARKRIGGLFKGILDAVEKNDRRGCFLCNASTDQAQLDPATQSWVKKMLSRLEAGIKEALKADMAYRENRKTRDKAAAHILTVYLGLRVLVKGGSSLAMLKSTVTQTLSTI